MAIVGIDVGTQSTKVVVTDDDLTVLGEAATAYGSDHPRPGWAQQDPAVWEEALAPTIAAALADAGRAGSDVRALGIAGQLDGCVAVGDDGRALGPCLIWMDRRAADELPDLAPAELRRVTGLVADAGHMAAKIRWLRRHAAGLGRARFHQPVSYLVERLTGAYVFDHGLASTTMLYSLADRTWDRGLLDRFEIEAERLPSVAEASARAGELSAAGAELAGLPRGIPVAVGTGDDYATPLGAGVIAPGPVACVLGTAEVVGALSHELVLDEAGLVETHGYAGGLHFVENPGWLSGGAVAWLRAVLDVADYARYEEIASAAPPGAGGLHFLPALSGAMAPEWVPSARGCFYGLSAAHGRTHIARALLEGCAFAMRDVVDRLRALEVPTDHLLLLGGGARSDLWATIRADVSGIPARAPARVDTCPIGAAMLAAVAGGLAPDLVSCAAAVTGTARVVEPAPERRELYDEAYAGYRALFEALRPLF